MNILPILQHVLSSKGRMIGYVSSHRSEGAGFWYFPICFKKKLDCYQSEMIENCNCRPIKTDTVQL